MERTLVILKPDTVKRKLTGEIISRFERKNFTITAMKMMTIQLSVAEEHYKHVKSESIYDDMIRFITSGPVLAMILEGNNIIQAVRSRFENLIHASDCVENAEIEIKRFFGEI